MDVFQEIGFFYKKHPFHGFSEKHPTVISDKQQCRKALSGSRAFLHRHRAYGLKINNILILRHHETGVVNHVLFPEKRSFS